MPKKSSKIKKPTFEELAEFADLDFADKVKALKKQWGDGAGLAKALGADPDKGLKKPTEEQLEERREEYGTNELEEPPGKTIFEMFYDEIQDPIIILLIICAVVSIVLALALPREGESNTWLDGVAITAAVVVVTGVAVGQNWSKEQKFRKLNKVKNDRRIKVWRGGKTPTEVSVLTLVVGDVVELATGDFVPADGVFLNGSNLAVDESAMTGEPMAQAKHAAKPFLVSGCMVATGSGHFVVTHVGVNSEWGILYDQLKKREKQDDTPLEESLGELAQLIGYFGFGVAIVLFVTLSIWWLALFGAGEKTGEDWQDFLDYLIQAIVIIVVAVPEGLPLAVTISLAFSMSSMLKDNNLVRKLAACETMGGATQICSDKTGTLTQNRMSVAAFWSGRKLCTSKKAFAKKVARDFPAAINLFAQGVSVNSDAYLETAEHVEGDGADVSAGDATSLVFVGNKTECALLVLARNLGHEYTTLREASDVLCQLPFSSDRKRMSTVIASKDPNKAILFCKGASEIVLGLCNSYTDLEGGQKKMTREVRGEVDSAITDLASKGLRTLCIAYRVITKDKVGGDFSAVPEDAEENLTLVSMVGIEDPLRPEVPAAIESCKSAGIVVRMVTGDNQLTAQKIAADCGIYDASQGHIVMEGPAFRKLTDEQLDGIIGKLVVLARSKPNDKLRLVNRLKHHKEVVAVTGDGTNDSPALKAADVGLAMGIAGTEIAKEASDIIIMDDNFASIVAAVKWGRNVRASIQKFLQFQITINIVALTIAFIGAVTGTGEPLQPIQLLWVNLQMDSLAALALATDKPQDSLLEQEPTGRRVRLISPTMWRNIFGASFLELVILLIIMYMPTAAWGGLLDEYPEDECRPALVNNNAADDAIEGAEVECPPRDPATTHSATIRYTFLFNTFVWLQLFNEVCARRISEANVFEKFWGNKIFLGVIAGTLVLQILFMQGGPFLGVITWRSEDAFRAAILWILAIFFGMLMVPWGIFIRKCVPVWSPYWLEFSKDEIQLGEGQLDAVDGDFDSDESSVYESQADDDADDAAPLVAPKKSKKGDSSSSKGGKKSAKKSAKKEPESDSSESSKSGVALVADSDSDDSDSSEAASSSSDEKDSASSSSSAEASSSAESSSSSSDDDNDSSDSDSSSSE